MKLVSITVMAAVATALVVGAWLTPPLQHRRTAFWRDLRAAVTPEQLVANRLPANQIGDAMNRLTAGQAAGQSLSRQ